MAELQQGSLTQIDDDQHPLRGSDDVGDSAAVQDAEYEADRSRVAAAVARAASQAPAFLDVRTRSRLGEVQCAAGGARILTIRRWGLLL